MNDAAITAMPEAALAAADHVLGDADAKLALLEYADYECPACIQAEPLMQHLVATSGSASRAEGGMKSDLPAPSISKPPLPAGGPCVALATHRAQGSVMPQKAWSAKRERQYVHIKKSLLDRGKPHPLAEEIAARVVNKERAQHGESVDASPSSVNDMSSGRRGGLRSHQGPGGRTLLQLRNEARQRGLKGRSTMNKAQLEAALLP